MTENDLTYEEALQEIIALKGSIKQYQAARVSIQQDFDYPKSLKRLLYLKNRIAKLKKKHL